MLSKQVGAPRFCKPIQSYEARANYLYKCQSCGCKYLDKESRCSEDEVWNLQWKVVTNRTFNLATK